MTSSNKNTKQEPFTVAEVAAVEIEVAADEVAALALLFLLEASSG
jgi:hypothetical protein